MNNTQSIVKTSTATPILWNEIDEVQAENLNGGGKIKIKNFNTLIAQFNANDGSLSFSVGAGAQVVNF
jgi:hypothetical protein